MAAEATAAGEGEQAKRVLVLDDDEQLGALLADYLSRFGMAVEHCADPVAGLEQFRSSPFDAVVLDVMMPRMDGFEVCRRLREHSGVPVLMLTARGDVADRVVGLELGADDYLPKPFEPRELAARLQALMRRAAGGIASAKASDLVLDYKAGRASRQSSDGTASDLGLTETEFTVLAELIKRRPEPVQRQRLYEILRGFERSPDDRSIDILVSRLRSKLGDDPAVPRYVRTVRLVGYAFIA